MKNEMGYLERGARRRIEGKYCDLRKEREREIMQLPESQLIE